MKKQKNCTRDRCSIWGVILLGPRIVCASIESTCSVIKDTFCRNKQHIRCGCGHHDCNICKPSKNKHLSCHTDCCEIPETDCLSKCICKICWDSGTGDTLHYKFSLVNTSKEERLFSLEASPFSCTDEKVSFDTSEKLLVPGEYFNATASFTIPESFAGGHYKAKITIKGVYEQHALLDLNVKSNQDGCCVVEQGEIPTRIRAHHWYNHFQSEVPCFEPVKR